MTALHPAMQAAGMALSTLQPQPPVDGARGPTPPIGGALAAALLPLFPGVSPRLARALEYYAKHGLPVLPLASVRWQRDDKGERIPVCTCREGRHCTRPGKHPICRGGVKAASFDPVSLVDWGELWRGHGNLGIATGGGRWVLDVDPRHGGDTTLAALEAQHGGLPISWQAESGSGGKHVWFAGRTPGGTSRANTALGLDAIAEAGYVVGPPSCHVSGGVYRWQIWPHQCPLATPPGWLLDVLFPPKPPPASQQATRAVWSPGQPLAVSERARRWLAHRNPAIEGAGGHNFTFGTVCRLVRGFDLDDDEALELLLDWNRNNQPPWTDARLRGFIRNARTLAKYPEIGGLL